MTREPLDNHLRNGDAGNLTAYSVDGKTQTGISHLRLNIATERHPDSGIAKIGTNGPPLDDSTQEHQRRGHQASETDAELIEDDTAKEQKQEVHIHQSVCT